MTFLFFFLVKFCSVSFFLLCDVQRLPPVSILTDIRLVFHQRDQFCGCWIDVSTYFLSLFLLYSSTSLLCSFSSLSLCACLSSSCGYICVLFFVYVCRILKRGKLVFLIVLLSNSKDTRKNCVNKSKSFSCNHPWFDSIALMIFKFILVDIEREWSDCCWIFVCIRSLIKSIDTR